MQHLTFINIKLHLTFYRAAIQNFDNFLQLFAISFNFVYPENFHIICKLGYNTSVNNLWICRTAQILAQIVWKLFLYLLCNTKMHYLFWTFFFFFPDVLIIFPQMGFHLYYMLNFTEGTSVEWSYWKLLKCPGKDILTRHSTQHP